MLHYIKAWVVRTLNAVLVEVITADHEALVMFEGVPHHLVPDRCLHSGGVRV
ncbi:hypothetical protein DPMN_010139 [Dreissena polymorpha]|uniref:Uncharacterized protein n=1 Tax=Dreissena polymorpha TaxID=45954 RepID=A0A9D4S0S1_DREPO|nr:hypothetical protein DPMN_010139 [Dreissena polymorpha]